MTELKKEKQKSIKSKISCKGVGLHSGLPVTLTLHPAPEDYGIVFRRSDIRNFDNIIRADYRNVTKTQLGTTISNSSGTIVSTVEHLMAALWGVGIDNVLIDLDGPEIPIMDGSSEQFVQLAEAATVEEQTNFRRIIKVIKNIAVNDGDKIVSLEPSDNFKIDLEIDFANKAISNQKHFFSASEDIFKNDIARARTFGFEHEVEYLRSIGLAKGGSLENAIVISGEKILNKEGLRFENEFARHKLLDCIGDFYLAGSRIQGNFKTFKSGHGLNNKLLHTLFSNRASYEVV